MTIMLPTYLYLHEDVRQTQLALTARYPTSQPTDHRLQFRDHNVEQITEKLLRLDYRLLNVSRTSNNETWGSAYCLYVFVNPNQLSQLETSKVVNIQDMCDESNAGTQ